MGYLLLRPKQLPTIKVDS